MPVYRLTRALVFPPPEGASPEGIVAIGGDASPERLVLAYSQGIFPWPSRGLPLLWFSPDPRFVLYPSAAHVGRSLRKAILKSPYEIVADRDFATVIRACKSAPRPGQDGTWITDELISGYEALRSLGLAHSIEAYRDGRLCGGLYGVSLGGAFFGESMFATEPDASKIAFVTLLGHLAAWGFSLVDCQVHTQHLERFGAEDVPRSRFLAELSTAMTQPTRTGDWTMTLSPAEALDALGR